MPSGTGKTVSLLSVMLASLKANANSGDLDIESHDNKKRLRVEPLEKMIYCSRTIPEIQQVTEEAKKVLFNLYKDETQPLLIAMGARRHLCINSEVFNLSNAYLR